MNVCRKSFPIPSTSLLAKCILINVPAYIILNVKLFPLNVVLMRTYSRICIVAECDSPSVPEPVRYGGKKLGWDGIRK